MSEERKRGVAIEPHMLKKNKAGKLEIEIEALKKCLSDEDIFEILKEEMQSIIDCIHDSIYITDGEGVTLMVNKASKEYLLRYPGPLDLELIGLNVKYMVDKGYWDNSICMNVIEAQSKVTTIQNAFGAKLLSTGIPLYKDGKIKMVVAIDRDVSQLTSLQNELEKSQKAIELHKSRLEYYRNKNNEEDNLVFSSEVMRTLVNDAFEVAKRDVFILIEGESGTGKEMLSNFIVRNSGRSDNAYVKINCAAIPENLMESEFFGYEPGAFTGANAKGKMGFFEIADGGTILLDEITELPLHMQSKLLRIIQDGEFTRVGGTKVTKCDVRIIAASNVNLVDAIKKDKFRSDLYYRLNVVPLKIPPLRERREDIGELVSFFFKELNKKYKTDKVLSNGAYNLFLKYDWPGNVRELKNVVERIVVTSKSNIIKRNFVNLLLNGEDTILELEGVGDIKGGALYEALEIYEKHLISEAVISAKTMTEAAKKLGVSKSSVSKKCKKYGISI